VLSCPSSISGASTDVGVMNHRVSWSVGASDNVGISSGVVCNVSSPYDFGVGVTSVLCNASDVAGNVGECSFDVEVLGRLNVCLVVAW